MRKITTVVERCNTIATFRRVSIWLMETTARWTPITPEMEVKVTLGRHIWEYAQMADALGKRTFELRQPEHYTIPATDAVLITEPPPRSTIRGSPYFIPSHTPRRLMAITRSNCSSVMFERKAESPSIPALL